MLKKMIGAAVVAALLAVPVAAHAAGPKLQVFSGDTGSVSLQKQVADSPLDRNERRIKLAVDQDGDDWAGFRLRAFTPVAVENLEHLGFDYRIKGYTGAGAPRISLEIDTTGDGVEDVYVYAAAYHAQGPEIGTSGWARTALNTPGNDAAIYASDRGLPYTADATRGAWDVFADAHAGARIVDAYVVMDESGQSYVDRVRIGNAAWS